MSVRGSHHSFSCNGVIRLTTVAVTGLVLIMMIISVAGYFLDRPVLISYARSGSMEPTIGRGDLFLVNPVSKGGDVGDIIVFRGENGWTVHRIYAVMDDGYLTKGDANPATDQSNGARLVRRGDVAGEVLTFNGRVLKIPNLGDYVSDLGRWRLPLISALVFLGGLLLVWGDAPGRGRMKKRNGRRGGTVRIDVPVRSLYWAAALVMIALFMLSIVTSWSTASFSYASTMAGGQRSGWYTPGSVFNETVHVENKAFYPFYYIGRADSGGVTRVEPGILKVSGRSGGAFRVTVKVPKERRVYTGRVSIRSYPAVLPLPGSVLRDLYMRSPYLPLALYAAMMAFFFLVIYAVLGMGGSVLHVRASRRSLGGRLLSFMGF
ncbi:MAG: signal peptidase I [Thermococci archaeon]|nr:signal peptidase I [Thermococci archaeon]